MARSRRTPSRSSDALLVERTYHRGIVRDSDVPEGGLYDAVDFLVEQPGLIYKRGGWERHSAAAGTAPLHWVSSLHIPQRVVTIAHNLHLYDVTSEEAAGATDIGNVGFYPMENSPIDVDRIIITDSTRVHAPKYVRYSPGPDTLVISNLENSPPIAAFSAVHSSGLVLAGGTNDYVNNYFNRLWFEPQPEEIRAGRPNWDTTISYIDATYEVTGLASVQGVLLIFSPRHTERLLGNSAPNVSNAGQGDMSLQPFLNVGCIDARSICPADEGIIFAGEEGVWWTNGSGVRSLTEKDDGTGIQSYWRSLFPRFAYANHATRGIVGGMINRDYYICCVNDTVANDSLTNSNIVTLLCHVPSASWTKVSNFFVNSLQNGTDEENVSELYMAEAATNYVSRASPMVYPTTTNMSDGNGTAIAPTYTTRNISTGPGLKSYGFGWLSYQMTLPQGSLSDWASAHVYALNATICVTYARSSFGDESTAIFKATTGGTSGSTEPDWNTAYAAGSTITDGTVTWTNQGPTLLVQAQSDLGRWQTTSGQAMAATGQDSSVFVVRKRFNVFRDTQALWIKVTQTGYSEVTEIQFLEVEERSYPAAADSVGR